jgi:hypothetical protein
MRFVRRAGRDRRRVRLIARLAYFTMALLTTTATSHAADDLLCGGLEPGPYPVGFRSSDRLDTARQYDPEYPAEVSPAAGAVSPRVSSPPEPRAPIADADDPEVPSIEPPCAVPAGRAVSVGGRDRRGHGSRNNPLSTAPDPNSASNVIRMFPLT